MRKYLYFSLSLLLTYLFLSCQSLFAEAEEAKEAVKWKGEVSLGYSKSSGNTEKSELSADFSANRKTDYDEITLEGNTFYSSSNKKMDAQKWYSMGRYAFSFWEREWYNFYKLEIDHDRFANIDYRTVPTTGIGYWFSDEDDWKTMAEVALGFEHTDYRDAADDSDEAVLVSRAFLEKTVFTKSKIREDLYVYASLENTGEFRLHSETVFDNPVDESLLLRISMIDDYDSEPAAGAEENDIRFTTSLVYSF